MANFLLLLNTDGHEDLMILAVSNISMPRIDRFS